MKPINIIFLICFLLTGTAFAETEFPRPVPENFIQTSVKPPFEAKMQHMSKRPSPEEFERRLNLTDEQKAFAKEQREKSVEKIKPILDKINKNRIEIEKLKAQNASADTIAKLESETRLLNKQAHEIRMSNMKAFEATLTDAQKNELQKIKSEGRREFEIMHKKHR